MSKSKIEQKNSQQLALDFNSFLLINEDVKTHNVICFRTSQKKNKTSSDKVLQRLLEEAKAISW